MKKLSKELLKERDQITTAIREKREALDAAIEAFNTAMEEAWAKVEEAVTEYNETLEPAREWVAGITGDIDTYTSERSDKWHESDKAGEYEEWKGEFEGVGLDDISVEKPDNIEFDEEDLAEVIEQLPEEVGG